MSDWTSEGDYDNLLLLRNGEAARVVLNRPDALNAWDSGLGNDLIHAIDSVGQVFFGQWQKEIPNAGGFYWEPIRGRGGHIGSHSCVFGMAAP